MSMRVNELAPNMLDIIFLALLTAWIFSALFRSLGQNDDEEEQRFNQDQDRDNLMDLIKKLEATKESEEPIDLGVAYEQNLPEHVRKAFDSFRQQDREINAHNFLEGAKKAFEMILHAYAKHDMKTLEYLLNKNVLKNFEDIINKKSGQGLEHFIELLGIRTVQIKDAHYEKKSGTVAVQFVSDQVHYAVNENNDVVVGNKDQIDEIRDLWYFQRDFSKDDKVWKLSKIS
jgi:predicted lipid-binding transport protein (Tim44 family)